MFFFLAMIVIIWQASKFKISVTEHWSRLKNAQKFPFELLTKNSRQFSYLIFEKTPKPFAMGLFADNCIYLILGMDVFFHFKK